VTTGELRYSLVLPAHNEQGLLERVVGDLVKSMRDRLGGFEIVIVENASTDRTLELAEHLADTIPQVQLITLPVADYGAAVAAGFLASRGDVVVHFDVDYVDLDFMDQGVAFVESGDAGIVLASKRAPGARDRRPLVRRLLTAGFTVAMRLVIGLRVSDAHGIKVVSRAECVPIVAACTMTGALYDVEFVLRALRAGVVVRELPADVAEVRPPRTPVWRRSLESATGLVRLRVRLFKETRRHP
jgi:glycosyltransferase involved in cell wall biosynthesis